MLVKPTHACFRTTASPSSSTPEPCGGAHCLLTSHNTTAQFRSRRQTQRQLGLLYVTTFHFYIAKYVASSGGAREQSNIFCPPPRAVVVVVPSLEILHHQPQYCPKQQKKDHNNIHKSNWYDCINILVMLLLSKWIHASSPSAVCFDIDEKDWQQSVQFFATSTWRRFVNFICQKTSATTTPHHKLQVSRVQGIIFANNAIARILTSEHLAPTATVSARLDF